VAATIRRATAARGLHDDITVIVVDLPPPRDMLEEASADVRLHDGSASYRGGSKTENLRPATVEAQGSPFAGKQQSSKTTMRVANVGLVQADVTVRRGAAYATDGDNGTGDGGGGGGGGGGGAGGGASDGGGCLAFLCGGGGELTSVDGVDDVESDQSSLRDDYEIGELLGRGAFGSVRACFLKYGRRHSVDFASASAASAAAASASASAASAAAAGFTAATAANAADAKFDKAVKSVACDAAKSSADRLREEVDTMLAVSGRHPNLPTVHAVYEQMTPGVAPGTFVQIVSIVTDRYRGGLLLDALGRRRRFSVEDFEAVVGLYKLNPADAYLESAWFQPLKL
jgi:hypothetical protein